MQRAAKIPNCAKHYAGKVLTLAGAALTLLFGVAVCWQLWNLMAASGMESGDLGAQRALLALGLGLLHAAQRLAFQGVGVLSVLGAILVLFSPLLLIGFGAALLRQSARPPEACGQEQLLVPDGGVE